MTWAMKTRDLLWQGRAEGREEGRAEGRKEGRAEGHKEGREEGIKALVVAMKSLSQTMDLAIQMVAEQFNLSLKEAEKKATQYWSE